MEPKRLYRSITDRKLAGVAGGLAEYFVMDPLLVRLAFVVLTLAGGGGILIYVVLWIVTPDNPVIIQKPAGSAGNNSETSEPGVQDRGNEGSSYNTDFQNSEPVPPDTAHTPQTRERSKGSLIGGLVLITLGALFLADELIPRINFGDLWPVLLIVIGLGLLINAISKRSSTTNQY
jgi:phage shock protein PspC (stress-responsive transcriptional regulator)